MKNSTTINPKLLSIDDCEKLGTGEIWDLYREYINPGQVRILSSFAFGAERIIKAEGLHLTTASGRCILDFTGGLGVLNHGHNHPRILAARQRFCQNQRMEVYKIIFSPYMAALAHNVANLLPGDLNKCFFPNSGAESVEGALKVTYKAQSPRRKFVLHADNSFHGKLIGTGTITGSESHRFDFPRMANTVAFRFNDLASVEEELESHRTSNGKSNVYAVIVEPFNCANMSPASEEFLLGVRRLCDQQGVYLIFDEVYTGWGKTGTLFRFMNYEVIPDVLCMSKSFGGGKASIAGLVVRDPVFERAYGTDKDALLHTSTFSGFGEECATAIEAINIIIDDDYPARARHIGKRLGAGLRRLQEKHPAIVDVRSLGGFNGVLLRSPLRHLEGLIVKLPSFVQDKTAFLSKITAASVIDALFERHDILAIITEHPSEPLLMAMPSLIATDHQIDSFLEALDDLLSTGLASLSGAFVTNKLKRMLGEPE